MAACSGCGAVVTGNFCAACGAPAVDAQMAPILLDSTGPQTAASRDRVQKTSRGRNVAFGLAILGLLLAGGVMLAASPTVDEPDAAAEQVEEASTETTETTEARTTLRDAQSARPSIPESDTFLGESVDWYVVAQLRDSIARIDLTTGEVEDLGLDGVLLGEAWGKVLIRADNGDLHTVAFDQLSGELPVSVDVVSDGSFLGSSSRVIASSRAGIAWLASDFNATAWQVDLSTGEIVRTVDVDHSMWFMVSPEFLSPAAGGIYALQDDDSYRLELDGRIFAEAQGRILVNRCDETLSCVNQWLDPDTFEELPEFFVPTSEGEGWLPRPVSNGRFLTTGYNGVLDSHTGEELQLQNGETEALWEQRMAISPDARVIAMRTSVGPLRLRLVDQSAGSTIEGTATSRWGSAPIFVPRTSG